MFVAAHRDEWARLDALVKRRRRLSGAEIDELVRLYQRAATHLSVLQATGLDLTLAARLSSQLARARAAIGGAHSSTWRAIGRFAAISFPATAYRVRWWWLGSAAGSILVALLLGWWVARSPSVQASLLPKSAANDLVKHQFSAYYSQYAAKSFAARVWTNNALVAASAVISGILLGLPVIFALFENAANGGIVGGLMTAHGRAAEFWGLILPHGMLELTSVFLAAGAGLRLGWAVIDPGPLPRSRAIGEAGRALVTIALGLIFVLAVSGVIEAFVTPSPLGTWARIGIGAVAEAAFLGYVIVFGRRAVAAGETGDITDAPDVVPISG